MCTNEDESPSSNWKWMGGVFTLAGLWLGIRFLLKDDSFAVVGLLTLICGIGLWLQQQWARWGGIGMCATVALFYGTMRVLDHTFSLMTLVLMLGSFYGAWCIWKDCRKVTALEQAKAKKPLVSLVLLLRSPRYLEARVLAESVSSAWGEAYSGGDRGDKDSTRWVVGETPLFMTNAPEGMFIINNFDRQYFENMEGVLEHVKELRLHKAIKDHQAWLSVDLISLHEDGAPRESVYPRIAKLIAELAGPDCAALFQPDTGRISVWDEALDDKLRGPECLEVFGVQTDVPVIQVDDDDPRMKAAIELARSRWPEFVEAFASRDGENFSIKAPITVGERREFIWVNVDGLEPEYLHGTLGNNPVDLGDLKMGDRVEVPLKDLNDWAFLRKGEAFGMFTVKVIADIQEQRRP